MLNVVGSTHLSALILTAPLIKLSHNDSQNARKLRFHHGGAVRAMVNQVTYQ
jgi:hypothetical protein